MHFVLMFVPKCISGVPRCVWGVSGHDMHFGCNNRIADDLVLINTTYHVATSKDQYQTMSPTIKEIHNARAPPLWNILCCPLVSTIGNLYRSITIYLLPCLHVLAFRCVHKLWSKLFCCLSWPYEDESFFGASALGDHDDGRISAEQMEKETDWVGPTS
jgi:hypothetical protein